MGLGAKGTAYPCLARLASSCTPRFRKASWATAMGESGKVQSRNTKNCRKKKKKVFDEGSGNVDLCGGDFVYVRNTGTHGNPMVLRKMKSVRRKIGSRNTKPTTRSLW